MEVTKQSDNEIQVTKTETKETVATYSYDFLVKQRQTIQDQKDRDNALRDAELVEVDALIAECDKLGVGELAVASVE